MGRSEPPLRPRSLRRYGVVATASLVPVGSVLAWWAVPDRHDAILAHLLYWLMPVVCSCLLAAGVWRLRAASTSAAAWLRRQWPGLLLAVATTFAVGAAVPSRLRVQFDETSLVAAARGMHEQHLAVMATGAEPYRGTVVPVESTVDKRPPLFAYLVSLMHALRGQRLDNVYVLNLALLALAQWIVFAAVRARGGLVVASSAPLLLLAVPLTSIVATSGGFELLAAVTLSVTLSAAIDCGERDTSARRAWLCAIGVAYAASRYEGLPMLLLVIGMVVWHRRGRAGGPSAASTHLLAAAVSVVATPLLLLLLHARQAKFYPEAGGRPLVAFEHLVAHVGPFLAQWFAPSLANPLPGVLAIAGAAAWLLRWRFRPWSFAENLVVVPVGVATVATLAWFIGDVREVIALRLFLPMAWLTALAPLWLVTRFGPRAGWLLLGLGLVLAPLRIATVARDEAMPKTAAARVTEAIDDLVRTTSSDPATTLWIATPAQHLIAMGHAALCPDSFLRRGALVQRLRQQGDVRSIFVLTTPLDPALAGAMGDPARVLQLCEHDLVARSAGEPALALYRLR